MEQRPVCLTIGGSDSCGGAGIQADLRMFAALKVTGCSAITALTAQSPRRITRIEPVSLAQLDAEIHTVFDYYDVAAVKTGMLLDADRIAVVSAALEQRLSQAALVVDPVMLASSGKRLLDTAALEAMIRALLPRATLLTPNLDEAAIFLGRPVSDARKDCSELVQRLGCAVLLKGGHAQGEMLQDILCDTAGRITVDEHQRQPWNEDEAHGTGCRLASCVAAHLANGLALRDAVQHSVTMNISRS